MVPTVDYDVDGDGMTKLAVDILRRVKARAETLADGAIFYNYQMQDGDNVEIIADKYYGSSQYHWVVLMMNNVIDHTYDLVLNDNNFERYIAATYGSMPRASGVSVNLTSYPSTGINSETHPTTVTFEAPTEVGMPLRRAESSESGNTGIVSGSFPSGNSTAIWIKGESSDTDPFQNLDVGDTVHLFVPETWYDRTSLVTPTTHSGNVFSDSVIGPDGLGATSRVQLAQNASDVPHLYLGHIPASAIHHLYVGGSITITSEGNGTTGITGNTRVISTYNGDSKTITITEPFEDIPQGDADLTYGRAGPGRNAARRAAALDAWAYTISYNASQNFPMISYTSPCKIVAKSIYKDGEVEETGVWKEDESSERYFQINVEMDSTTFDAFTWDKTRDIVYIQTGIHHFERDLYDATGTILLADGTTVTQEQYVNTSIGTASTKKIVTNLEYEAKANEDKRTIYLLKRDFLMEFVEEFETLMKLGV